MSTEAAIKGLTLALEMGTFYTSKYGKEDSKILLGAILAVTSYARDHQPHTNQILTDVIDSLTTLRDSSPAQIKKGIGRN